VGYVHEESGCREARGMRCGVCAWSARVQGGERDEVWETCMECQSAGKREG